MQLFHQAIIGYICFINTYKMLGFFKKFFSKQPKLNIGELIAGGATIVDVRSKEEYRVGHLNNSINIPLNELTNNLSKLNKTKAVITCCASGMRSSSAKNILKSNGFNEVHNGGGWTNLRSFDK
jgi:phage shock protein E